MDLREITKDNWEQCARLKVPQHQSAFTPSNAYSIAEAKFNPDLVPLAIYDGEEMVGLIVVSFDPEEGRAWIHRLMIDADRQGKGYTRTTMKKMIGRLRQIEGCRKISVRWPMNSRTWEGFYSGFGFEPNGERSAEGEIIGSIDVKAEDAR